MTGGLPKILVVDDDADIVRMLESVLRLRFEVLTAPNGLRALEILDSGPLDAVMTDQMMPGLSGVELLGKVQAQHPGAARVLVTASQRVNVLRDAVNQARVHRFLSKPLRLAELPTLLTEAIREATLEATNERLVAELKIKNEELGYSNERLEQLVRERTQELELAVQELRTLALHDGLTGLYNHRHFQEAIVAELARAERHQHPLGLLFIDVDHFKHYNDQHGHPAGDRLLRQLAAVLTGERDSGLPRQGRVSDLTARYGGEEFVVLLPETDVRGSVLRAERIRRAVAECEFEHRESQPLGCVSVSVGLACYPDHAHDRQGLVDTADRALYRAKAAGRNRVVGADGCEAAFLV
jgi:diguanylate cyclase (GGDEF)-like protein